MLAVQPTTTVSHDPAQRKTAAVLILYIHQNHMFRNCAIVSGFLFLANFGRFKKISWFDVNYQIKKQMYCKKIMKIYFYLISQ